MGGDVGEIGLFFFKQKKAYEMRISDWSSDVCSSDLDGGEDQQPAEDDHKDAPNRSHRSTYTAFDPSHACGLLTGHPGPSMPAKPLTDHFPPADSRSGTADRQSVVEGKRVSVRVELGGRRLIQKTKPNEKTTHK